MTRNQFTLFATLVVLASICGRSSSKLLSCEKISQCSCKTNDKGVFELKYVDQTLFNALDTKDLNHVYYSRPCGDGDFYSGKCPHIGGGVFDVNTNKCTTLGHAKSAEFSVKDGFLYQTFTHVSSDGKVRSSFSLKMVCDPKGGVEMDYLSMDSPNHVTLALKNQDICPFYED